MRGFQVLTAAEPARVSVLDFGGADVSLPLSFGDAELGPLPTRERVSRNLRPRVAARIEQREEQLFVGAE